MRSMSQEQQHHLEFGGSPVHDDFDGTIAFKVVNRVPVVTASYTFGELTARQFRYLMAASFGPETPFHQPPAFSAQATFSKRN